MRRSSSSNTHVGWRQQSGRGGWKWCCPLRPPVPMWCSAAVAAAAPAFPTVTGPGAHCRCNTAPLQAEGQVSRHRQHALPPFGRHALLHTKATDCDPWLALTAQGALMPTRASAVFSFSRTPCRAAIAACCCRRLVATRIPGPRRSLRLRYRRPGGSGSARGAVEVAVPTIRRSVRASQTSGSLDKHCRAAGGPKDAAFRASSLPQQSKHTVP